MGIVAEASGGFCCAGRDGKIYFKTIGEDEEEISLRLFKNYKFGEEYKISRVAYEDGIRSFKFGNETRNTLWINQDNIFIVDEEQIENIYNKVKDLTINSFEGTTVINPALDMGDKIIIDGKPVIYQGEMTLSGRFIEDIKSKISIKQNQETTVKKESQVAINRRVQSQIDQAEGKITLLAEEQTETDKKMSMYEQTVNEIKMTVQETKQEAIEEANANTNEKLQEYTTTVQSLIQQKSDSILSQVSATYATQNSLNNVNKTLTASLELKVDTKNLISEINASADIIRLNSGRLIVNSDKFQLDEEGKVTCSDIDITGGKITLKGGTSSNPVFRVQESLDGSTEIAMTPTIMRMQKNGLTVFQMSSSGSGNCSISLPRNGEIDFYGGSGGNSTNISANGISTPTISASAQITVNEGKVMHGRTGAHYYQCYWTDTQMEFWVDGTNVGTLSDKRLKKDIQKIDDDFICAIEEIEMKQFKVINRNGLVSFGILAQDLMEIFEKYNKNPFDYEIIQKTQYNENDNTVYYTINYEQFLILKAKTQEVKIQSLTQRIEKLEGDN